MARTPGDILLDVCLDARDLFLVAPYMKRDTLGKVLMSAGSVVSLTCITRWRPDDIIYGASDIECRSLIVERKGSFRLHPFLHAKYYRVDDTVFVGSANLTSSAMGWASQPNLEIFCNTGCDFKAQEFEYELLRDSREINDIEFDHWEALGKIVVENQQKIVDRQPSLQSWRPATRDPRNLELAYLGREDEIASFDEQKAARRDIKTLSIPVDLAAGSVRAWISTCLLSAPFTNSVIRLRDTDIQNASYSLAKTYDLGITEARRDMETVQNWLSFLNLEV